MSDVKLWGVRDVDNSKDIVLMDLDGTLAQPIDWDKGFDPAVIADPNLDVVAAMRQMRKAGYRAIIWTCRTSNHWGRDPMIQANSIHAWMEKHELEYDGILMHDKPLWSHYLCDNSFNADDWTSMLSKAGLGEEV